MSKVYSLKSLIGKQVRKDVFTDKGLLLITEGTILTESDVQSLVGHRVYQICVAGEEGVVQLDPGSGEPGENTPITRQLHQSLPGREVADQYIHLMARTKDLFSSVSESSIPPLGQFTDSFFPLLDQVLRNAGFFHQIYLIEGSDHYTYRHSINVGLLASLIGRLLKRPHDEIVLLGQAGLLHDIGKMLVPPQILMKPGRLSDDEYAIMKQHTIYGFDLLQKMDGIHPVMAECALHHHERLDGTGYPHGKTGIEISLESQIVAVADVFDAICSDRVYKPKTSPFEAAKLLWKAACARELNPEIVIKFIYYITSLNIGSRAVLNNGDEVEIILVHPDEPMKPLVKRGEEYLDLRYNRLLWIDKMLG